MSSPWTIRCVVPENGEILGSDLAGIASLTLFDRGALAVGETSTTSGEIELIAGFETEGDARSALDALTAQLPDVRSTIHVDADHDAWVQAQQDGLEPTTIGQWTVRAPWHERSDTNDVVIDPGAAFGHGAHPSTRLAIELMLSQLRETAPLTVVDLGTGTGVIAIIAARLGCQVRATEFDATAVDVARSNIDANAVAHAIELTHGDAADSLVEQRDLVVANVTLDVHRMIAANYATADRIIVAGLLCSQVSTMTTLLPNHRAHTIRTTGEWAAVSFLRTPQR